MVGAARAVPWRVKVGGKEWLWRKHVTKQLPKSKYNELYQMKLTNKIQLQIFIYPLSCDPEAEDRLPG